MYFFFNDTATTEIYTLSLHDALPIYRYAQSLDRIRAAAAAAGRSLDGFTAAHLVFITVGRDFEAAKRAWVSVLRDRKSTRLNSSHVRISYAVFCLIKKITTLSDILHI